MQQKNQQKKPTKRESFNMRIIIKIVKGNTETYTVREYDDIDILSLSVSDRVIVVNYRDLLWRETEELLIFSKSSILNEVLNSEANRHLNAEYNSAANCQSVNEVNEASNSSDQNSNVNEDDEKQTIIYVECERYILIRNREIVYDSNFETLKPNRAITNERYAEIVWERFVTNDIKRFAIDVYSDASLARYRYIFDINLKTNTLKLVSFKPVEKI